MNDPTKAIPVTCRELPRELVERIGLHVERIVSEREKHKGAVVVLCRVSDEQTTLEIAPAEPFYAWLVRAGGPTEDVRARVASFIEDGRVPLVCVSKVEEGGEVAALFEVYPLRIAPMAPGGDA